MAGGPSALVKLGELLVQRASDAYSFFVVNFSAVPGWYSSFCNCHIETIPESLNFQFLRLMFLRICPYLLQDDRMGIWNAQKRVGHFIHPRKLWGLALSWSRADLLASAYDGIPYQHCHQNLKAWSSEKIDSLFKRVQTWIQIPSFFILFPFSSFQSSGMSSMPVLSHCPNGFCTEQLVGQILTSSHQVMLGRSSKHKRHPRQGNTSITEQHLAEMIRDQDICGEWWAEWYGDPPWPSHTATPE